LNPLFPPLPAAARHTLDGLGGIIDKVIPLPGRFRAALTRDVAELSRLLTSGREERGASYLGRPALLSAYLRYFLPWNVYRLCRLFSALPLNLQARDGVNDFGAGPLTLTMALWISRPDLRKLPLEFRCLDRTAAVLEAGKKIFTALCAETGGAAGNCPWEIRTIRGELRTAGSRNFGSRRGGGLSVEIRGKPAALSAAVNVYNELFWSFSPADTEGLSRFAGHQARLLSSLTENSGSVLVVEPGIPRSGEFISLLRSALMNEGRLPLSPCVHPGPCPMSGVNQRFSASRRSGKWCHFTFDTEDAPKELLKLSAASAIPKERAALSFLLAGPVSPAPQQTRSTGNADLPPEKSVPARPVKIRILSDAFPVDPAGENNRARKPKHTGPEKGQSSFGRYGCSSCGLVLVTGTRETLEASPSGSLENLPLIDGLKDAKSGAQLAKL